MQIEFKLTRADYVEFIKLVYARMLRLGKGNVKFFWANIFLWMFIGMGFMAVFSFYEDHQGMDFKHLNLALAFWGMSVFGFVSMMSYQRKFYMQYALDEQGHMLKNQSISIDTNGIRIVTENTDQSIAWSAIQEAESAKHLICLYIDNSQAVLLPKNVFSTEAQLNELLALIESKLGSKVKITPA